MVHENEKSIVKQIRTRGLRSGEVLSGSAYGLDRGMLDKICDHMMRQTIKSTASMEDRFYMTLTYNACGRGGEAACASFDQGIFMLRGLHDVTVAIQL